MKVSGIFKTLIIVVCCIILGAMVINIFLPNVVAGVSNAIENSIFQATGMHFDFNGDGTTGSNSGNQYQKVTEESSRDMETQVDGFSSGGGDE